MAQGNEVVVIVFVLKEDVEQFQFFAVVVIEQGDGDVFGRTRARYLAVFQPFGTAGEGDAVVIVNGVIIHSFKIIGMQQADERGVFFVEA